MGSSGGLRSKTKTVIRTANTASENALNRSGVAAGARPAPLLCATADSAAVTSRYLP